MGSKCNYCNKEIEDGYLKDDYYAMCEDCRHEIYTKEEYEKAYQDGEVFWTVFYE